jgi:hypothetical protein
MGVGAQGNFVFGQRFLETLQVEQHVSKHFAGGQFGFPYICLTRLREGL